MASRFSLRNWKEISSGPGKGMRDTLRNRIFLARAAKPTKPTKGRVSRSTLKKLGLSREKYFKRRIDLITRFGESVAKRFASVRTVESGGRIFSESVSAKKQNQPFVVSIKQKNFMSVINQWPGLVEDHVEQILNEVTILAFENVKERTPVLTGRAKSQWFITVPSRWTRFIGNNVPYIRRLEHGWSGKANRWYMVRSTEKKIPMWVNQIAGRIWRGGVERRAA